MATRSNIVVFDAIQNNKSLWYRHYDSYPEMYIDDERKTLGMGPVPQDLSNIGASIANRQCETRMATGVDLTIEDVDDYLSQIKQKGFNDEETNTYEKVDEFSGDINYLYVIILNGKTFSWNVIDVPMYDDEGNMYTFE